MKTVRFLTPAESEMVDAAVYYERQARGLGIDFLDRIEAAADDIARNPEQWAVIQNNVRKKLVQRFPTHSSSATILMRLWSSPSCICTADPTTGSTGPERLRPLPPVVF